MLTEVHDEAEVERALSVGATLVGVNARNLKTLEVDPGTFGRLAGGFPTTSSRWRSPGSPAPTTRRGTPTRAPTWSWSARPSCATATPRAAVARMKRVGR